MLDFLAPSPIFGWMPLVVRVQNWRNQQEITAKQRAEINEMERVTAKGNQEDTSNKWKVREEFKYRYLCGNGTVTTR